MPTASARTAAASADPASVAAFLRALAERAEQDPACAMQVAQALAASGLLAATRPARRSATSRQGAGAVAGDLPAEQAPPVSKELLDPFAVLRTEGEPGLRAQLSRLEAVALHTLVRTHRLDPARISARWSSRERLVDLIVAQVRARADHGKAFARA